MDVLFSLAGLLGLVLGAELMVRGAVDLALRVRMSPLVVGLTVVSIGTSVPELLVSLLAALRGASDIAMGNVVGSNIANIGLVLGMAVMIFPVAVDRDARRVHWPVMMAASVLLVGLLHDNVLARWEGGLLVLLAVVYVVTSVRMVRRTGAHGRKEVPGRSALAALVLVVAGVAAAGMGADLFVRGASGLARALGASDQLVGLTVVAVGTSLPELVTSLVAAFRRQPDISLGNLVGSNIFNILGILGVAALAHPIALVPGAYTMDLWTMLGLTLLLGLMMRMGLRLGRVQGMMLLVVYVGYLAYVLGRG